MSLRVSQSVIDHLFEVLTDDFLIPLWIEFIVKCEGNQVRNVTILELYSLDIWFFRASGYIYCCIYLGTVIPPIFYSKSCA